MKVGIAQVPVAMGDVRANVRAALAYADRAGRARCDVVVFPECSLAGWCSPAARGAAEPVPGPFTEALGRRARRDRMAVVVGMEERLGADIFNSAVLIGKDGAILAVHRKIHELEIGRRVYSTGRSLGVSRLGRTPAGIHVCADAWVPELTDALWRMGARVIFSPCAWAVKPGGEETNLHWIAETYAARTAGRDLAIVAANGVGRVTQGPWRGRVLQGNSLVVGPGGRLLLRGPTNRPGLLTLDLRVDVTWAGRRRPAGRDR